MCNLLRSSIRLALLAEATKPKTCAANKCANLFLWRPPTGVKISSSMIKWTSSSNSTRGDHQEGTTGTSIEQTRCKHRSKHRSPAFPTGEVSDVALEQGAYGLVELDAFSPVPGSDKNKQAYIYAYLFLSLPPTGVKTSSSMIKWTSASSSTWECSPRRKDTEIDATDPLQKYFSNLPYRSSFP